MVGDALLHQPLFQMFVSLEVRGAEQLDELDGPVIFVANHQSYFDQPSFMFALPGKLRYRTATAAWKEFFFGDYHGFERFWRRLSYEYSTWFLNIFPLPQKSGFARSLRFMGKLADTGTNILIFPEGGHSLDAKMQTFQPGLGIIAKELGIPVVPVKISGTRDVLPPKASFPKRGNVTVTFGKPLHFRFEQPGEIVDITRRMVEEL